MIQLLNTKLVVASSSVVELNSKQASKAPTMAPSNRTCSSVAHFFNELHASLSTIQGSAPLVRVASRVRREWTAVGREPDVVWLQRVEMVEWRERREEKSVTEWFVSEWVWAREE